MCSTRSPFRKWEVDSQVRYIKAVGGPTDKQVLLVGLKNGKVWFYCVHLLVHCAYLA